MVRAQRQVKRSAQQHAQEAGHHCGSQAYAKLRWRISDLLKHVGELFFIRINGIEGGAEKDNRWNESDKVKFWELQASLGKGCVQLRRAVSNHALVFD